MAKYGVLHTTNVSGKCFSFVYTADLENGSLVTKGALIPGETSIYAAGMPDGTSEVYVVGQPAWSYDDSKVTNQNEDEFIVKAGTVFRAYELKPNDKITMTDYSINGGALVALNNFVADASGSAKPVASATAATSAFVGKITEIRDLGFAYAIGSAGTANGDWGYTADNTAKMVTVEVIKNG